jgi:ceramide glucosyltransferase
VRFIIWCCGFFGNTIEWRGTKFKLVKDGKLGMIEKEKSEVQ